MSCLVVNLLMYKHKKKDKAESSFTLNEERQLHTATDPQLDIESLQHLLDLNSTAELFHPPHGRIRALSKANIPRPSLLILLLNQEVRADLGRVALLPRRQ